jgi:hypothetical protein
MKSINVFYTVIVILLFEVPSLANEKLDSLNHSTFEIFVTKYAVRYNSLIDYSKINLDTIQLRDTPFLTYNEIESYDSSSHIINLKIPIDSLDFPFINVHGHMFVVLVNSDPVYCGFFWTLASSISCRWIVILDSNELNGLTKTQIQISAGYPDKTWFTGVDPRNSPVIISDFEQNGMLTNTNSHKLNPFRVYPNPTSGKVTLAGINKSEKISISVYNQIGELVKEQEQISENGQIDLSKFSSGVYFLKINFNESIKIIKK